MCYNFFQPRRLITSLYWGRRTSGMRSKGNTLRDNSISLRPTHTTTGLGELRCNIKGTITVSCKKRKTHQLRCTIDWSLKHSFFCTLCKHTLKSRFFKKILQANKTSFFLFYWLPVSFTFIHIIIWYDVAAISFLSDLLIKRAIYNMLFRFRTFHCYNAGSSYFVNAIIIPLQFKEDKRLACNACSYSDTVLKWFADNVSCTSQGMIWKINLKVCLRNNSYM